MFVEQFSARLLAPIALAWIARTKRHRFENDENGFSSSQAPFARATNSRKPLNSPHHIRQV